MKVLINGAGAAASAGWVGPLGNLAKAFAQSPFVRETVELVSGRLTRDDLVAISRFLEAGKIKPVIEKTYSLADAAQALQHVDEGHASGKTVITIP
jgi:NADPH:quinone reductase-like Zn-dependent oxidoreductase